MMMIMIGRMECMKIENNEIDEDEKSEIEYESN